MEGASAAASVADGAETGLAVNRSYAVWDYRPLQPNFLGQICLCYFTLWIPLSAAAVLADDALFMLINSPSSCRHDFYIRTHAL